MFIQAESTDSLAAQAQKLRSSQIQQQDRQPGALLGAGLRSEPKPQSPLQIRMEQMHVLIKELDDGLSRITDAIQPILSHDPRQASEQAVNTGKPIEPPKSQMDAMLLDHIGRLSDRVTCLNDLICAVRL